MAKRKFKSLPKGIKILSIINYICSALIMFATIAVLVFYLVYNDKNNRTLSCIGVLILALFPICMQLLFRYRLNPSVYLFYNIYIIISGFVGCCLNAYNKIIWYDDAVHVLFGYVGGLIGLFYLCKTTEIKKLTFFSIIFFCFCTSMTSGALWEIMEFFADNFLGQTAQGIPVNGITSVTDTMIDFLCDLLGATAFCVHYFLFKITRKNLLIGFMQKDFQKDFN